MSNKQAKKSSPITIKHSVSFEDEPPESKQASPVLASPLQTFAKEPNSKVTSPKKKNNNNNNPDTPKQSLPRLTKRNSSNKKPSTLKPPTNNRSSLSFAEKLAVILCNGKEEATVKDVLNEFKLKGILDDDPRVEELVNILKEELIIPKSNLIKLIQSNIEMMKKIYTDDFCVKKFNNFVARIKKLYNDVKQNNGGNVASYIPQLAKVNPKFFGISVCTVDGQRFSIGDCDIDFCIQSCCKIINYCIAYEQHGDAVHKYVGKEPSGVSFNALTLDSTGKPHNPCINAGAIMTCSLINNHHVSNKNEQYLDEFDGQKAEEKEANRFEHLLEIYSKLCNAKVGFNNSVYLSERATGHRNYALGHFMKEQNPGFPPDTQLTDVLEFYFQCCSLEVTANKLSVLAGTLASGGTNPLTSEQIFSSKTVKNCLSLMNSCGMYDYSGEFAFKIGIPSKSGVGGGIISVIPGLMGICVWSPALDKYGNSVRGIEFLTKLGQEFNFHHFDSFETSSHGNRKHALGKSSYNLLQNVNENKEDDNDNQSRTGSQASTVLQLHDHNEMSLYRTILYASVGDLGGLKRLYLKGFDLSCGDYDKRTPLHLAASNGHINIVKYLGSVLPLQQMNPQDRWLNTPYMDAKREGHTEILKYLERFQNIALIEESESDVQSFKD